MENSPKIQAFAGFSYTAPDVEMARRIRANTGKTNEFLRSSYTSPSVPESFAGSVRF